MLYCLFALTTSLPSEQLCPTAMAYCRQWSLPVQKWCQNCYCSLPKEEILLQSSIAIQTPSLLMHNTHKAINWYIPERSRLHEKCLILVRTTRNYRILCFDGAFALSCISCYKLFVTVLCCIVYLL